MKKPRKSWAQKRLQKKNRQSVPMANQNNTQNTAKQQKQAEEYLTGCAIIREDVERGNGERHRTHADLRRSLGDEMAYSERPGDIHGYWTNTGRFVSRLEGSRIAVEAGQAPERCFDTNILSSDISWNVIP